MYLKADKAVEYETDSCKLLVPMVNYTHRHTHAGTHARTHARVHTYTHTKDQS